MVKIFVGNLSFDIDEHDLAELFAEFGEVERASIARHERSRHPRGFGFVEMPDRAGAEAAIDGLDGTELKGRTLKVNKAKPRSEGRGGGGRPGGGRRF